MSILDGGRNTVASAATDITGFNYFPTTGVLAMNASHTIEVTGLAGFTDSTPPSQFSLQGSALSFNFSLN